MAVLRNRGQWPNVDGRLRFSRVAHNFWRPLKIPGECRTFEAMYDEGFDNGRHHRQSPENSVKIGVFRAILAIIN